jgi:protein-L-isoaspartate(D-aspartate) O-methyltransferase
MNQTSFIQKQLEPKINNQSGNSYNPIKFKSSMENTPNYEILHDKLESKLIQKGIFNPAVLKAIRNVPRHLFVDKDFFSAEEAYYDIPLPIGEGQTISQPYTVAYQTQLLEVRKGHKVLEIGTGSGYQSAVLEELGAMVYTIERQKKLYARTKKLLYELGYASIKMFFADGNEGRAEYAPFDRILVTAAASEIPYQLVKQLKIGGKMVIPLNGNIQKMTKITKTSSSEIELEEFDYFRFVPLLSGTAGK